MSTLNVDRIAFVNIRNGKIFFDCHPSEARLAMRTVEQSRKTGQDTTEFEKSIQTDVERILSKKDEIEIIDTIIVPELKASHIAVMFREIEKDEKRVNYIIMNAFSYTDLRKFDRDILEITTQATLYNVGMLAQIWGAKLIVKKKAGNRIILANTECENDKVISFQVKTDNTTEKTILYVLKEFEPATKSWSDIAVVTDKKKAAEWQRKIARYRNVVPIELNVISKTELDEFEDPKHS